MVIISLFLPAPCALILYRSDGRPWYMVASIYDVISLSDGAPQYPGEAYPVQDYFNERTELTDVITVASIYAN